MAISNTALPAEVPATVTSAARTPRVAPVEITSMTIGPGVRSRRMVMARKPKNRCQFIGGTMRECGSLGTAGR